MKFCYVDESGRGDEAVLVVAGVIVDSTRMHRTKTDWSELLGELGERSGGRIRELKGGELYRGNAWWRNAGPEERTAVIDSVIAWMVDRSHKVSFGAVRKQALADHSTDGELDGFDGASAWAVAAMHLVLTLQKGFQSDKRNKLSTVFVFDEAPERKELLQLIRDPPAATDRFYNRSGEQPQLDQLIDVPYFADSQDVGLIQVADFFAFFLRLHAELQGGLLEEKYEGEAAIIADWVRRMKPILLRDSLRWPKTKGERCTDFFRSVAPPSLLDVTA